MQDTALAALDAYRPARQQHASPSSTTGWHQGVIGIVASRLKDNFYPPDHHLRARQATA